MSRRADGSYSPAWRRASKIILWPLIQAGMKHDWHGQENISNIPADQGIILAINHLSYADIFADSLFAYEAGRYPVFLAKSSLFDIKVLGTIIRKLGTRRFAAGNDSITRRSRAPPTPDPPTVTMQTVSSGL